jgi:hypothetical protein
VPVTNPQIKHKMSTNIYKQNTKHTIQKQYCRKESNIKITGTKTLYPEKNTDKLI